MLQSSFQRVTILRKPLFPEMYVFCEKNYSIVSQIVVRGYCVPYVVVYGLFVDRRHQVIAIFSISSISRAFNVVGPYIAVFFFWWKLRR